MLIKEMYSTPEGAYDLIETPDGSLYRLPCGVHYKITPDSRALIPVNSPLRMEELLRYLRATPYEGHIRDLRMQTLGLTDIPLKEYRTAAGMTQQQLADASGVNSRQIQRIENGDGKMSNVTLGNAVKLADALNIDPRDLL